MSIRELARKHGLSRATLLYYDRIGLLRATARDKNGYRKYSAADDERLGRIVLYRKTGIPLSDIRKMMDKPQAEVSSVLMKQLEILARQIEALRERQHLIVRLLRNRTLLDKVEVMNRATWTRLLAAAGFSEDDMHRWHCDFERLDPGQHQRFLKFLGIDDSEIARIRDWSRMTLQEVMASK